MSNKQAVNQEKFDSIRYLSCLTKNYLSLRTRIAIITYRKKFPHFLEMLLLFIEYTQMMSQAILLTPIFYSQENIEGNVVINGAVYLAKSMDTGSWLYLEDKVLTKVMFVLFALVIGLKYFVLFYVIIIAKLNLKGYSSIMSLWGWIFKAQGRIICFFITSFCFKIALTTSQDDFDNLEFGKTNLLIVSILMILMEYMMAFYIQIRYCCVLPSNSFLAGKTNLIETFTLLQKLTIQILQATLTLNSISTHWIIVIINLSFSILREGYYFYILPLYDWKALAYQARLSIIVTSLNLSYFFEVLTRALGYEIDLNFIFVVWIFLVLLMIKLLNACLGMIMMNLIENNKGCPEYLIQKISIIKYLKNQTRIRWNKNTKYNLSCLLNSAIDSCITTIFHINPSHAQELASGIGSKQSMNKLILHYLESISVNFPNNALIKLYSAYISGHKLEYFGVTIKMISNIKQHHSEKIKLNAFILIDKMQRRLQLQNEGKTINIFEYVNSIARVATLKVKMQEQAKLQSKVLKEILGDTPNLQKISQYGQIVDRYISRIKREIKYTLETIPDTFIEPLMVCAHYSLALNDSIMEYLDYQNKYSIKCKKYEKYFTFDNLIGENLFQEGNALIIFSGQKVDAGKILYCTKSVEKIYGNNVESYIGMDTSSLVSPCQQPYYSAFFKSLADKGHKSFVSSVNRGFGYNINGYAVPVDYFIDFHPFMTQNFCFSVIVRPVPSPKEYLLLYENGDIDCGTEKISRRLKLLQNSSVNSRVNISLISEELGQINYAFNMIALPDKYKASKYLEIRKETDRRESRRNNFLKKRDSMKLNENGVSEINEEKAKELYSIYSTKGEKLELAPLNRKSGSKLYPYQCMVKNMFYGSTLIKLVTLDEYMDDGLEDILNEPMSAKKGLNLKAKIPEKEVQNELSKSSESERGSEAIGSENSRPPDEIYIDQENNCKPVDLLKPYKKDTMNEEENAYKIHVENVTKEDNFPAYAFDPNTPSVNKDGKKLKLTNEDVCGSSKTQTLREYAKKKSFGSERSLTGSQRSKSSLQQKISNAFKTALGVKYYPKSLTVICVLFYLLLIVIFSNEMSLKRTVDSTLEFIETSKEIVGKAEMRNYLLTNIQQSCRLIWDLGTNKLNKQNMRFYGTPQFYVVLLDGFLISLANTNENLFKSMNSLDEDLRNALFMKDVKIFDTYYDEESQSFGSFDNFQATNRIIGTGLKGFSIMMRNITQGKSEIHFLLRNSVNDVLLKNELTSNLIMEAVNSKLNNIRSDLTLYLIVTISLLLSIAVAFVWVVWKQFLEEKQNMLAITRLNPIRIEKTLDRIREFKKILNDQKLFHETLNLEKLDLAVKSIPDSFPKQNKNKGNIKTPEGKGIVKKYWFFALSLVSSIIIISGLILCYSMLNEDAIDSSQIKQTQFFFINRLKSQIYLATTMGQELFASNGTTQTHNQPNSEEFPKVVDNLIKMQNRISEVFMNKDHTYDPQIQDILFNDGCLYMDKDTMFFCNTLKNSGRKTGLIYIITDLVTQLEEAIQNFEKSNKTAQSLIYLEARSFEALTYPNYVSTAQCGAISNITEQILQSDIRNLLKKRDSNYWIFGLIFVIFSIMIWFLVIKPLREANNRFKKVLQVFPANIILSNFVLKSFLIKTSKNAFDSVKNDI